MYILKTDALSDLVQIEKEKNKKKKKNIVENIDTMMK